MFIEYTINLSIYHIQFTGIQYVVYTFPRCICILYKQFTGVYCM